MIRTVVPGPVHGRVRAPPSKSYTHRALVTAFLSGHGELLSPLDSEDTRATARGLVALGAEIHQNRSSWRVTRRERHSGAPVRIDCGESGTTLRLLTAVAALGSQPVRFTGRGRLPYRPMETLFAPLCALGAEIRAPRPGRSLPFTVQGPIRPGRVTVSAGESSQPISALLLALSSLPESSEIRLTGEIVSEPYIAATIAWLRSGGQRVERHRRRLVIPGGRPWRTRMLRIPGDASSAAYLWASAASSGGRVVVHGIDRRWPQADLAILDILKSIGVEVVSRGVTISASGRPTRPLRADLTPSPDLYPLAGALAALVPQGMSHIQGAPHAVHKESDRRRETVRLVTAIGGTARVERNGLRIQGTAHPRRFHLTDLTDHRLVMSAAVAALAADGPSRIGDAGAVRKSYPGFWSALATVQGAR